MKELLLALVAMTVLSAAPVGAQTKDYWEVSWQGKPVDTCLYLGSQCGKPAGDRFCQLMGHAEAVSWSLVKGIGDKFPTTTLGDMKTCSGPECDAFLTMTCKLVPSLSSKALPTTAARLKEIPPRAAGAPTRRAAPGDVAEIPGGPPRLAEAKLVTTSASVQPAQPTAGQQISVSATVQNQGGMPSQKGLGLVLLCTTLPGQPSCPGFTFAVQLPTLAAGQSHQTSVPTGVAWPAGKYRLVIGTDVLFDHDAIELELVVGPASR